MTLVLTRTPVRLSFGGGGTDLPSYYEEFGGLVLSTTIDKYFYSLIEPRPEKGLSIISADMRLAQNFLNARMAKSNVLKIPLAVCNFLNIDRTRLFLASQIPKGSGLGLSGAVTVNLLHGLLTWQKKNPSKRLLAELASKIEIEILGRPIGKQDQYASAFGGLNLIIFEKNKTTVKKLNIKKKTLETFQKNLLLFFTGQCRDSAKILKVQNKNTQVRKEEIVASLDQIKKYALTMKEALLADEPDEIGRLLHLSWASKKRLARGITSSFIDTAYETALKNGAFGGKITGAGGGGFFLVYCPLKNKEKVSVALNRLGLKEIFFKFENSGSQVLLKR